MEKRRQDHFLSSSGFMEFTLLPTLKSKVFIDYVCQLPDSGNNCVLSSPEACVTAKHKRMDSKANTRQYSALDPQLIILTSGSFPFIKIQVWGTTTCLWTFLLSLTKQMYVWQELKF